MKEVLNYANTCVQGKYFIDFTMLKVCLCFLGLLAGLSISKNKKEDGGYCKHSLCFHRCAVNAEVARHSIGGMKKSDDSMT